MKAIKKIAEELLRLFRVKSIVTLALTAVFCYMSARGRLDPGQFMTIFTTVIAFYFGTQSARPKETKAADGKAVNTEKDDN